MDLCTVGFLQFAYRLASDPSFCLSQTRSYFGSYRYTFASPTTRFILVFSVLQCTHAAIVAADGWIDLLVSLVVSYIDVCFDEEEIWIFWKRELGEMKRGVCDPVVVFSAPGL